MRTCSIWCFSNIYATSNPWISGALIDPISLIISIGLVVHWWWDWRRESRISPCLLKHTMCRRKNNLSWNCLRIMLFLLYIVRYVHDYVLCIQAKGSSNQCTWNEITESNTLLFKPILFVSCWSVFIQAFSTAGTTFVFLNKIWAILRLMNY